MMTGRRVRSVLIGLLASACLVASARAERDEGRPIVRDLQLESLREAVRWPNAERQTVLMLVGRFIAGGRDQEAHAYFGERAASRPDEPLFLALEGFFQARVAAGVSLLRRTAWVSEAVSKLDRAVADDPGLPRYFRGLVLAELPRSFGKADAAVADLDWVLQNTERFPVGIRRSVHRGLARAYTTLGREGDAGRALERSSYASLDPALPVFTTDAWVTARDGFRFRPPRLVEVAPRVWVAQGYDFGDIAFVVTADGIVAIDAGTTVANARAALEALRRVTPRPITHVILTHAHWDHVGGLAAFTGPGTRVIAQARFADELRIVNETGVPFRYFFGGEGPRRYTVVPDRLVSVPETLTVGGTELTLYPVRGGETEDALFIHLPDHGVLFVGDAFMPYFGAPFLPEGSPEGFFEMLPVIHALGPRLLVHGHPPLTENFTVEALPGLEASLRTLYQHTRRALADGRALADILHDNVLPASLQEHPVAVVPYLVMREHFIRRIHHQRTGYWQPDGENLEVLAPREWAAALDVLAGGRESAFVRSAETLLARGDALLALKLSEHGLLTHPESDALLTLRRRALDALRARHQALDPFKFIIYSEQAGAALPPAE